VYLETGRVYFQDPLGIIAAGLFDGLNGSVVLGKARLSMGAFYTGFLYKETSRIIMTADDLIAYAVPFDYDDMNNYFASRRVLVTMGTDLSDLTPRSSLTVNVLGQFDMNPETVGAESRLHTQYLSTQYTFLPLDIFTLTGTVVAGLAENQMGDLSAQFALAGAYAWDVPGALWDMMQGEVRWSSGAGNEGIIAFAPVTSATQGQVFKPKLSGLMTIKEKYTARLHRTFSAALEGTYFIRTDGETLTGAEFPPSSSRLMGGEVYGNLLWAPTEELMLTLGSGAFFPGIGDVFEADAPVRWRVTAGLSFSL
jgi:hypothetical protein